jgi:hypothetical protein
VHYVLDSSGRVIDVITGLHDTGDFLSRLRDGIAIGAQCGVRLADRSCVAARHREALEATQRAWTQLEPGIPTWDALVALDVPAPAAPSAVVAMPIAIGKMSIEAPMLRLMGIAPRTPAPDPIAWEDVVARVGRPPFETVLSEESQSLARLKTGRTDDEALLRATFDRVTRDTVQNRFTLERRVHAWLADETVPTDFASIDTRVYAELFLTPASDPWLGLRDEATWDVLEVNGSTDGRN